MEFEAPTSKETVENNPDTDIKKRALLGKLAEEAVVELHGETAKDQTGEGEIFSQRRVAESLIRHEAQLLIGRRQEEISTERQGLAEQKAETTKSAEAAA